MCTVTVKHEHLVLIPLLLIGRHKSCAGSGVEGQGGECETSQMPSSRGGNQKAPQGRAPIAAANEASTRVASETLQIGSPLLSHR